MMMARAMNQNTSAKTAEIMSRYRPIAPKPEMGPDSEGSEETSDKINQSPYLRNVWAQLQARPTRTRKRGRTAFTPPAIKRHRTQFFGLPSPSCHIATQNGLNGLSHLPVHEKLTLPLMPSVSILGPNGDYEPNCMGETEGEVGMNLNRVVKVPEEKDLIQQLQGPVSPSVISPQPVRPVGSSISVGCINEGQGSALPAQSSKKRQEVEDEVESEFLPAVVSDSNNKVRLTNSAYKEMVGQPECSWLDSMVCCGTYKITRISGEVMLNFSQQNVVHELLSSNGFSCWVTIEWGTKGNHCSVHAFCDVTRLACESKDYAFEWRFHTMDASDVQSAKSR